jgi:hypothetical protein
VLARSLDPVTRWLRPVPGFHWWYVPGAGADGVGRDEPDDGDDAPAAGQAVAARLIGRLGEVAGTAVRDRAALAGEVVAVRDGLRRAGRYAAADDLRVAFARAGVVIEDHAAGPHWHPSR